MKFPTTFGYATRVWLTTIVMAPILGVVWSTMLNIERWENLVATLFSGIWMYAGMLFLVGLIWSIPGWLLFIWLSNAVAKIEWNNSQKKWALFGIGTAMVFLTIVLLSSSSLSEVFGSASINGYLLVFYWIPAVFGIFFYRLPVQQQEESEQSQD